MSKVIIAAALSVTLSGCAMVAEKSTMISDDRVKSQASGALGYPVSDIELVSRRTEGTNTFVVVRAKDRKEFACTLNGGNILTMGMVNPPTCNLRK